MARRPREEEPRVGKAGTGARRPTPPRRPHAADVAGLAGGSSELTPRPPGSPGSSGRRGPLNPGGLRPPVSSPMHGSAGALTRHARGAKRPVWADPVASSC